jgi:bifunctional DNA-binding transcriptional regulator/antitoxin component of YhaV-PrlF toxin-antitoxin module
LGEITTLTKAATKTTSLRTTVPMSVVKQFKLKAGDKLDWTFDIKNGKMVIIVEQVIEQVRLKDVL